MSLHNRASGIRGIVTLLALTLATACTDSVEPPANAAAGPSPRTVTKGVQATYTYTLPTTPDSYVSTVGLNTFSVPTAVRITVSGFIDATHLGSAPNNDRRFGPFGWSQCGYGMVAVYYGTTAAWQPISSCSPTSHWIESFSVDVTVQGTGVAQRTGEWSQACYDQSKPKCWSYSGSQTVKVEVLDFDATLHAWQNGVGYVSAIRSPADLYFNWQPDSATPGATPIQTMSWSWENDDGSPPPNLSGWYGYNNIGVRISKSGTMSVVVRINGVLKTLKKHIYVGPIELGLRANPTVVADTGEAVTAVAFPVPEALASDKPPVTVEVLQWTFTDSITAAISQPCAAGVNPCVFNTGRSGTLKVRGKVAGVEKTAETKISAIKCKTGNPLLDSKRVRDRLKQMYDSAVTANRETKMYFYRNADGTYEGYWGTPGPQGSSLCGVDAVPPFPSTAALTLVGFAHVHLQGLGQWANCPGQIPQRIVVEGHHEKDFERIVWFDPKKGQSSAPDFGLESIVSDPNAIYRSYPPDLDPFNTQSGPMDWHNAQKKYSKQGGQCGW